MVAKKTISAKKEVLEISKMKLTMMTTMMKIMKKITKKITQKKKKVRIWVISKLKTTRNNTVKVIATMIMTPKPRRQKMTTTMNRKILPSKIRKTKRSVNLRRFKTNMKQISQIPIIIQKTQKQRGSWAHLMRAVTPIQGKRSFLASAVVY